MSKLENLTIVPASWRSQALAQGFYPEDMPKDWRLDYYCGQFACVIMPEEDWLLEDSEVYLEELQDCLNDFNSVILQLSAENEAKAQELLKTFSEDFLNSVVAIECLSGHTDVKIIAGKPVFSTDLDVAEIGGFAKMIRMTDVPTDPKQQTARLQSIVNEQGDSSLLVVVDAVDYKVSDIANMQAIAELLGY